jgi:bifunctional DNA-binding transcriptional regulator/antitoxin component of YhaV-PrlF toxin-antitoxin module
MSDSITGNRRDLRVAQRGLVTLPKAWRETYAIETGDAMTLLDLGGVFVLVPHQGEVDRIADRLRDRLEAEGETIESLLLAIREERARYDA